MIGPFCRSLPTSFENLSRSFYVHLQTVWIYSTYENISPLAIPLRLWCGDENSENAMSRTFDFGMIVQVWWPLPTSLENWPGPYYAHVHRVVLYSVPKNTSPPAFPRRMRRGDEHGQNANFQSNVKISLHTFYVSDSLLWRETPRKHVPAVSTFRCRTPEIFPSPFDFVTIGRVSRPLPTAFENSSRSYYVNLQTVVL